MRACSSIRSTKRRWLGRCASCCAILRGDEALLYAGAGIVGDSDPLAEFGETELKMRVMLEALAAAAAGP